MQAVKAKDTSPEMLVRKLLHADGYRYRLHLKTLPGKPDLAFPARRKVIFVNGCFWHGHECNKGKLPKSKLDYWEPKIRANRERDARKNQELAADGWEILTIWQCQTKDIEELRARLWSFLGKSQKAIDTPGEMR